MWRREPARGRAGWPSIDEVTAARSAELAGPSPLDQVAGRALERLLELPGVTRAGFAVSEGGRRQLLFTATDRGDDTGVFEWCRIDPAWEVPLNRTARNGELVAGTLDELEPRFASFVNGHRDSAVQFIASVPVSYGEEHLGGFVLYVDHVPPDRWGFAAQLVDLGRAIGADLVGARHEQRRRVSARDDHPADAGGTRHATHDMPGDLPAIRAARRFLRATLEQWEVDPEAVADALLCLAELATNAVVHTHGGCRIQVSLHDRLLRVQVRDHGSLGPIRLAPAPEETAGHGRGLRIVSAIASRSGRDPAQCLAWFELDLPDRPDE